MRTRCRVDFEPTNPVCPYCGATFESRAGLNMHWAHARRAPFIGVKPKCNLPPEKRHPQEPTGAKP